MGDEVGNPQQSLEVLDQWESELEACYAESQPSRPTSGAPGAPGSPRHPVFVALKETVRQSDIPKHEFSDLLIAFREDQAVTRFETFYGVLGYCRYSANPVAHLVLYLCGYRAPERQKLH